MYSGKGLEVNSYQYRPLWNKVLFFKLLLVVLMCPSFKTDLQNDAFLCARLANAIVKYLCVYVCMYVCTYVCMYVSKSARRAVAAPLVAQLFAYNTPQYINVHFNSQFVLRSTSLDRSTDLTLNS